MNNNNIILRISQIDLSHDYNIRSIENQHKNINSLFLVLITN